MIVTFKTKASGNLIYFKDVAIKLLALMGRDDKVPSALFAEDVPAALTKLQRELDAIAIEEQEKAKQLDASADAQAQSGASKAYISLNVRAKPLLEMLQKAEKKRCEVQWE